MEECHLGHLGGSRHEARAARCRSVTAFIAGTVAPALRTASSENTQLLQIHACESVPHLCQTQLTVQEFWSSSQRSLKSVELRVMPFKSLSTEIHRESFCFVVYSYNQ